MGSVRYPLDSVIIIDHCNGIDAGTRFIKQHSDAIAISAITRAEVLAGFMDENFAIGAALLDSFAFLAMDQSVADEAARARRRTNLKLPDAIQAAYAIVRNLTLVTRNTKDFSPDKFAFVEVAYRLGE